jgi:uncharacterized protein YjbI with pentapeptide repeats
MVKETAGGAEEAGGFEPPKYLASLIAAIADGAKAAQAGMLLFLLVGLYLLATAFSASDEDILLGKAVTISQIGASLPVSFSFAIAPLVFVFLHLYALTRHDMLGTNVRYFLAELRVAVPCTADQERCRQLLPNVEFVQTLTAPRDSTLRSRFWPYLVVATMAGFPVLALLLVQINALRYQSDLINWVQRAWLLIDIVAIVAFFIRNPLNGRALGQETLPGFAMHFAALAWLPPLIVVLNLDWLNVVRAEEDAGVVRSLVPAMTWSEAMGQPLDRVSCPLLKWGCRYLRVEHRTLVDHAWDDKAMAVLRTDDVDYTDALAGIEGVVLRGRNLRFAVLDESRLYAADLIGADLSKASMRSTRLQSAKLSGPSTLLQGANLEDARLAGADLSAAWLTGARLAGAKMKGARLARTIFNGGVDLTRADLTRANLNGAFLVGADMSGADLAGSSMYRVQAVAANLGTASLEGAILQGALLAGANLYLAQLMGADLEGAQLAGAILSDADLSGADLKGAHTWNVLTSALTTLDLADLRDTDFRTPPNATDKSGWAGWIDALPKSWMKRYGLELALMTGQPQQPLNFAATAERPILVSDPKEDAFKSTPSEWLLGAPETAVDWVRTDTSRSYLNGLADLLTGEIARGHPAVAEGIARRIIVSLSMSPADFPASVVACRLLDESRAKRIKLSPGQVDSLIDRLRFAKVDCAALTASVGGPSASPK